MPISPRCGQHLVDAPEEVVGELGRVRRLEAGDAHAHRVEAAEAVLDGAVLARGVHALQHDEHGALVLGHQHRRELRHALGALGRAARARSPRRAGRACASGGGRRGRPWSRGRCASRVARSCIARTIRDTGRARRRLRRPARRARCGCRTGRRRTRARARAGRRRAASRSPAASSRATQRRERRRRRAARSAGWAFVAGANGIAHADVQLLRAAREPAAAAACERRGLLELGQAEQPAVERARLLLAAGRRGHLHVIDADDPAHSTSALRRSMSTTSRRPSPNGARRLSACRRCGKPQRSSPRVDRSGWGMAHRRESPCALGRPGASRCEGPNRGPSRKTRTAPASMRGPCEVPRTGFEPVLPA